MHWTHSSENGNEPCMSSARKDGAIVSMTGTSILCQQSCECMQQPVVSVFARIPFIHSLFGNALFLPSIEESKKNPSSTNIFRLVYHSVCNATQGESPTRHINLIGATGHQSTLFHLTCESTTTSFLPPTSQNNTMGISNRQRCH